LNNSLTYGVIAFVCGYGVTLKISIFSKYKRKKKLNCFTSPMIIFGDKKKGGSRPKKSKGIMINDLIYKNIIYILFLLIY
jgi:hypothetical protein